MGSALSLGADTPAMSAQEAAGCAAGPPTEEPPAEEPPASSQWQPDQFAAERLERARRLLESSEEHRGDADLQAWQPALARRQRSLAGARPC